jgi:hypothetical protein
MMLAIMFYAKISGVHDGGRHCRKLRPRMLKVHYEWSHRTSGLEVETKGKGKPFVYVFMF